MAGWFGWIVTLGVAMAASTKMENGNSTSGGRQQGQEVFRQRLREYLGCTPCRADLCPGVPDNCRETVMEIGVCACCKVCALTEGSPCGVYTSPGGVYTAPCGSHLSCTPLSAGGDSANDVLLLLQNKGICQPSQRGQSHVILMAICRPSGCTVASGVVGVVVGVCNRSQMRTSKIYMFNFWCEYSISVPCHFNPWLETHKRNF